ncbi:MAG: NUDIX domain-containing protein [Rhodobacterales bacterium]|jgi:ADP-ribose pyrophosphatase|nr:NUDIX domain-containing protein [Rhodobacterales bacterium]
MSTEPLFLYGTLLHDPLFALVAGPGDGAAVKSGATLKDHAVDRIEGSELPMLLGRTSGLARGAVWTGLTVAQRKRLDIYELAFDYVLVPVKFEVEGQGPDRALAYFPPVAAVSSGEAWSIDRWRERSSEATMVMAEELDQHDPPLSAPELARQWNMIAARAHSRLRARRTVTPATLRHDAKPGDHHWSHLHPLAGGFFKLAAMMMTHRRFDGGFNRDLPREVLVGVDAALLLPYDVARDRVLMIEQFRTAPARRGDNNPWTLEPVAGIVDAGETPEAAARRETEEEAGLSLKGVEKMFAFYASPGSNTDYFHCFLGLADLPDDHVQFGGLDAEGEDIRLHLVTREHALRLIETGEITAGPLVAMLLWLDRNRARLADR